MPWGYEKDDGPDTWCKQFPVAAGQRQSPIDIQPSKAVFDQTLAAGPLTINYSEEPDLELENPGLSFKANIQKDSFISGGPLGQRKFKLVQFHFHWGHDEKCGSEHTIDGMTYPSELHLVHYNTDKYQSFDEAVSQSDGLAVIGIFIQIGSDQHKGFQCLAANSDKVKCKASKACTGSTFNPASLLPSSTSDFWTYEGSLTTPPCFESVQWIVLKEEISISLEQMNSMRCLCCDDNGSQCIPSNFRPPLPIGNRELRASFH